MRTGRNEPTAFALRAARADDCAFLFAWTNTMRACGLTFSGSEPLERGPQDAWFAARLEDPDCRNWVVEHAGVSAGMVRLEREADRRAETVAVSVYIVRESRHLGLASAAIERALRDAARERSPLNAVARVRPENTASLRLFEAPGFAAAEWHADHVILRRRVPE